MIILVLKNESVQFFNMASFEKEMALVHQFNQGLDDGTVLNLKQLGKVSESEIKSLEHCPRIYEDSDTIPFGHSRPNLNEQFEEHLEILLEVLSMEFGPDGNSEMVREFVKDVRESLGSYPFRDSFSIGILRDVYEAEFDDFQIRQMFVNTYLNAREDGSESDGAPEVREDLQGNGSGKGGLQSEGIFREAPGGNPGADTIRSKSSEGGSDSGPDLHSGL